VPVVSPIGIEPAAPVGSVGIPGGFGVENRSVTELTAWLPAPERPAAPPAAPVRLHQGIAPPVPISNAPPVYPSLARTARIEGTVILDVVIDEQGRVTGAKVLRSAPLLDQAAIDAITAWRYEPARLNGTPIAVAMPVTVRFTLAP
jgi:protein TonB